MYAKQACPNRFFFLRQISKQFKLMALMSKLVLRQSDKQPTVRYEMLD